MASFTGQVSYHLPSDPLLKFFQEVLVGQKQLSMDSAVDGPAVFTDGSGKTGKAAVTWKVKFQTGSPQIVEVSHGHYISVVPSSCKYCNRFCLCSKFNSKIG